MIKAIAISLLIFLSFTKTSFGQDSYVLDWTYSEMFEFATGKFMVGDTLCQIMYGFYVVIVVEDLNTGVVKEVCVQYHFLEGAIRRDSGKTVIDTTNLKFSFSNPGALENIGFYSYSKEEFDFCTESISVSEVIDGWEEDPMEFGNMVSGECQKYIAHFLFDEHILTSAGGIIDHINIESKASIQEKIERRQRYK